MTSPIDLAGRTLLITGASSGIGAHFAKTAAHAGARVVLAARRADRLAEGVEAIIAAGGEAIAVTMDVTDEASTIAAFDAAEAAFGPVDTVVANAGTNADAPFLDLTAGAFDALMAINLRGVFLTVREAGRRMIAAGSGTREHGRIVIVSSITATAIEPGLAAYSASKAAVLQMGRVLARDWARKGINVNSVLPGYIVTGINDGWFDSEQGQKQMARFPRRRMMVATDLDPILLYLSSDASRAVTGAAFTIDDGQSLSATLSQTPRLISLASGVLPEFTPVETTIAAIASGWPAVGIWVDPATWTNAIAAEVRARTADAGTVVLDAEVIWLKPGDEDPDHFRILDAGAAIGARNALVVSSDPDAGSTAAKLGRLIDHGRERGLRVCMEFAAFTAVRSLGAALDILDRTGRDDAALLIDPLHFARTGGVPADLAQVDPLRLPYVQFCDASAQPPPAGDIPAIIHEALDLRMLPGAGALPLPALLAALPPGLPLSVELRSSALRTEYPDATARAALRAATTGYLEANP